jgi:hypothetical protein
MVRPTCADSPDRRPASVRAETEEGSSAELNHRSTTATRLPCGTQITELPDRCPDQQERTIRRVQDYRAPISSDQPTRITKKYPELEL